MIDIKMFARKRAEGTGRGGSTTPWTQSDDVRHALSADKATFAEQADKALQANDAARAAYADKARALAEDSPAYDEFLRKDKEDTAKELINFLKGITIGDIKISYDEKNGALVLTRVSGSDKKANLYATGGLTAFGAGSAQGGGGSGTSYERLDRWSDYTTAKAAAVLSAFLGNDLNERLKKVEGGALTSVDWSIIRNKPNEFTPAAHSHTFASLLNKPTTLQGYGITDAASISHTHAFSALTNKPTTVDGYGIIDTFKTHVDLAPHASGYYAVMTTKTGIDETWRHVISMDWSKNDSVNWISQLALPTFVNSDVYYRKNEGQGKQIKDAKWIKIWDEKNLTKLSQLTDDVVTGKYLSLAGGTMQDTSMVRNLNSEFVGGKHFSKILTSDGNVYQLSLGVSTEGGSGSGYRCVTKAAGLPVWSVNKLILAIASRHKGVGIITILFRVRAQRTDYEVDIRAMGSFEYSPNQLRFYYNADTATFSIWTVFSDYDTTDFSTILYGEHGYITLNGDNTYYKKLPSDVGTQLKCNVNSATRLDNPRTIWGQNFDGTGNVTGALSSVTNINNLLHFTGNNIGIGTNTPIYKLDVNGNARITDELLVDSYLNLANNKGLRLRDKEGGNQRALFISDSNAVYFGCNDRPLYTLFEGSELQFNIYQNGWQTALVISRDKTAQFHGNVLAMGGVTAYTTSDRRLKENIKQVDSMRIIRSLGGTWQFDYKDSGEHGIGFIAQSVKGSILRNMVYADTKGYLKLNYLDTRLIALALGAAVQVDDKVERLKKRVMELEKEVESLKHN